LVLTKSPTTLAPIGYPDKKAIIKGYTFGESLCKSPDRLINSENIKKGNNTGTIELAQMIIAVFVPISVTLGNNTIISMKRHDAITITLFFILIYIIILIISFLQYF
jgi:hypothetical protein